MQQLHFQTMDAGGKIPSYQLGDRPQHLLLTPPGSGKTIFPDGFLLRPHPPFDAPPHYFDLYSKKELHPPYLGSWETEEQLQKDGRIYDSKTGPIDPELQRQAQIGYYACITHLDHQIGRLIMALKEHGLYDNSAIIFTSDHGEELCDHHLFRKARPYEGSCHIPLLISGGKQALPNLKAASVCNSITELRDIIAHPPGACRCQDP